jgi:hypothetical protein
VGKRKTTLNLKAVRRRRKGEGGKEQKKEPSAVASAPKRHERRRRCSNSSQQPSRRKRESDQFIKSRSKWQTNLSPHPRAHLLFVFRRVQDYRKCRRGFQIECSLSASRVLLWSRACDERTFFDRAPPTSRAMDAAFGRLVRNFHLNHEKSEYNSINIDFCQFAFVIFLPLCTMALETCNITRATQDSAVAVRA